MEHIATKKRSLVKAITWRVGGSISTLLLAFVFTGSVSIAAGVCIVDIVLKLVLYYFHERAWDNISWGRKKHFNASK